MLHQLYIYTDVDQHLAACILLLHPCTLGDDQLMATLMDHTGANCRRHTHMQAEEKTVIIVQTKMTWQ